MVLTRAPTRRTGLRVHRSWLGDVAVSLSLAMMVPGVVLYAGACAPLAAPVILAGVKVLASIATVAHPSRLRVMASVRIILVAIATLAAREALRAADPQPRPLMGDAGVLDLLRS